MAVLRRLIEPGLYEYYNDTMVMPASSAAGALVQPPAETSSFQQAAESLGDTGVQPEMDRSNKLRAMTVTVKDKRRERQELRGKKKNLRKFDREVKRGKNPEGAAALLEALIRNGTIVDERGQVSSPGIEGPRNSTPRILEFMRNTVPNNPRLMQAIDDMYRQRHPEAE